MHSLVLATVMAMWGTGVSAILPLGPRNGAGIGRAADILTARAGVEGFGISSRFKVRVEGLPPQGSAMVHVFVISATPLVDPMASLRILVFQAPRP